MSDTSNKTEIAAKAAFCAIRYAQCWEDSEVLNEGLNIQPGDHCLSIASAGDNALAMLLGDPERVVAVDLNPAQLACCELRIAAYRNLDHSGLLRLIGSREGDNREDLYRACREDLSQDARAFWDARPEQVRDGIGGAGKFERYFQTFREKVLPLVHSRSKIEELMRPREADDRMDFHDQHWDSWRWRMMFRVFFSRFVMGRVGRDPSFFAYVEGSVADRIRGRATHALRSLDPSENPYLRWILTGSHAPVAGAPEALPLALRPEHFDIIRDRLDRVELKLGALEEIAASDGRRFDRFNLSDIFEYMSEENTEQLLQSLVAVANPGGRLLYWNMLVPRSRPESMADSLSPVEDGALGDRLLNRDNAFFYSRVVVEEVM